MITLDYFRLSHPETPQRIVGTKARCEECRDRNALSLPAESYSIELVPHCRCCGYVGDLAPGASAEAASAAPWSWRCEKHRHSNPCAIEGCKHSTAMDGRAPNLDGFLCGEHWRRYCPPRSARRRAYHAFFRKAKRLGGWTDRLKRQYWRFWGQLIRTARAKAEGGSIDPAAIAKLFGWDES